MKCISCEQLPNEVTRLRTLLDTHGITPEETPHFASIYEGNTTADHTNFNLSEKIAIFRRLILATGSLIGEGLQGHELYNQWSKKCLKISMTF
jgi:hypothetical protein